jgi:hypothetical protein
VRVPLLRLADQIAAVAAELRLPVLFQPHVGPLGAVGEADGAAGRIVQALLEGKGARCVLSPVLAPAETAWLTQRAALVASSR